METLQKLWDWIFNTPVELQLPWYILLILALIGGLSRFFRYTYKIPKLFGSLIHESGHALVALLLGMHVNKIKLDAKGNGVTEFYTRPGIRNIPVALAGYLAPATFAISLTYLIISDNLNAAIALSSFIFLILAIFVRSIVAIILNLLFGGLLYLLLTLSPVASTGLLMLLVGVLIASGITGVWEAYAVRTRGTGAGLTDSQIMAKLTLVIPSIVWDIFFALLNFIAAVLVIAMIYTTI